MKYEEFTNEQLSLAVAQTIAEEWRSIDAVDVEKFDDIDLLTYADVELLNEWHKRVHAVLGDICLGRDDLMHYLSADWHEYSLHWYNYPACHSIVKDACAEYEAQCMDAWESRYYR